MTLITANYRLLKIIGLGFLILLLVPLLIHHYLALFNSDTTPNPNHNPLEYSDSPPSFIIQLQDVDKLQGQDLKYRIEELLRIKQSVSLELHTLEARRRQIQLDITQYTKKLEEFKSEAGRKRNELDRLQITLEQAKVAEREAMERNTPRLLRPKSLGQLKYREYLSVADGDHCTMETCFDFSLCPVSNPFSVYLYPVSVLLSSNSTGGSGGPLSTALHRAITASRYATSNPYKACLYIAILDSCTPQDFSSLKQLLYWNGDGRNHLIWPVCEAAPDHIGRAMLISSSASRPSFDLITSHLPTSTSRITHTPEILQLPPISPAKRKYLATYLGAPTESSLQSELLRIQQEDAVSFVFQFSCSAPAAGHEDEDGSTANRKLSDLCNNDLLRTRLLIDSTFSLILLPPGQLQNLQLRLYESLKYGAIPVLLGSSYSKLPYSEVIDWARAVLSLPSSRVTELHYILKYVSDPDLLLYRKNGRLLYENYLSSLPTVVDTTLGLIRTRIGLPALPYKDIRLHSVFNDSFTPLKLESITLDPEDEENLGPIEPPYPSPSYTRNFSSSSLDRYTTWNSAIPPFSSFPHTPWDSIPIPSEAKFRGSSLGFRPIAAGQGGAGKEFSESLGGNLRKEQFTIVMLTYEREQVLINSLSRLYLLPYLNKVIVVWNSVNPPNPELHWPDIGVPIITLQAPTNSLNNRFLPFTEIETEAILSIDDDAHLRHDEIVFGFRVWRENRDRIVGFPGRYHAWAGSSWAYNSNYSCELSMVLTGAAFHHKIYSYLYTYEMSSLIRSRVDELMNCEDIAMNFLVSHITGKPPVKVTSRWTFRCPGCPVTLSEDDSHFQERHTCINYFSQVYGYTPLLYTQYRADSILFKTRIPHDKQKCFKYI